MRFHFVTVPMFGGEAAEAALNAFVASHRVLAVERQLVPDGPRSAWAVCVVYTEAPDTEGATGAGRPGARRERVDYREVLSEGDFAVFVKLRELRKRIADREGVPPYAVFTNEQLAEVVKRKVRTLAELGRIDGVGPAHLWRARRDVRGGWNDDARNVRAAYRNANGPSNRKANLGFQLAGTQTPTGGSAPDQTAAASVAPPRRRIRSGPLCGSSGSGCAGDPSRGFHLSGRGRAR